MSALAWCLVGAAAAALPCVALGALLGHTARRLPEWLVMDDPEELQDLQESEAERRAGTRGLVIATTRSRVLAVPPPPPMPAVRNN